jgi:hypothetical protein
MAMINDDYGLSDGAIPKKAALPNLQFLRDARQTRIHHVFHTPQLGIEPILQVDELAVDMRAQVVHPRIANQNYDQH